MGRLRGRGYKATPQRLAVLRTVAERPNSDIAGIREGCPRVGLVTIYRTLDLLCDLGLVRRLGPGDGKRRYKLRSNECCHFVCEPCGRVFDLGEMAPGLKQALLGNADFEAKAERVEVYGRCLSVCADCA